MAGWRERAPLRLEWSERRRHWPALSSSCNAGGGILAQGARRFFPGGRLIAVEGCDGSGKSTQLRLLHRHLRRLDLPAHLTSWNSSPAVHPISQSGKRSKRLFGLSYALFNAADFADRYEREILPRLELGQVVLCDRYVGTALARDGARGLDPAWTEALYAYARPADLTFLFQVPPAVAAARVLTGRKHFGYYEAGMDLAVSADPLTSFLAFQGAVLKRYLELAEKMNYQLVDATRGLRAQQLLIRQQTLRLLEATPSAPVRSRS